MFLMKELVGLWKDLASRGSGSDWFVVGGRRFWDQAQIVVAAAPMPAPDGSTVRSFLRSLWIGFNDFIAFTANLWQNIDGLVFTGIAVYLLIRLARSVLGHDDSTIKTST